MPDLEQTKETRLATAIKALDEREVNAYKYFIRAKQGVIADDTADEMFQLYLQGASCEDIRRARAGFGLGQIVACRVMGGWDARRAEYRKNLESNVPARAVQVQLEQVDFLADLLTATQRSFGEKIRQYIATGDSKLLEGIPIPKNVKDYNQLLTLFMASTGQDKKQIVVSGKVTVDHNGIAAPVSSDEAGQIMDRLLNDEVIDVEVIPARSALPPNLEVPRTAEMAQEIVRGTKTTVN